MSDQIKNRVVGTIVLVALAIILIPKIFDGEKETQNREFVAIPAKPIHQLPNSQIKDNNVEIPKDKVIISSESTITINSEATVAIELDDKKNEVTDKTAHETTIPNTVAVAKKQPDIKTKAWVIRMGTFGNPDNVNALVVKLRSKGFTAFSVPQIPKKGVSNKVFIGPELNQNVLIKFQPQLKRDFQESGIIELYEPLRFN